jgi:hypothetical protein
LDDEVKAAVKFSIQEKSEEFFSDGMTKPVTCWEKCVTINGDYVEACVHYFSAYPCIIG